MKLMIGRPVDPAEEFHLAEIALLGPADLAGHGFHFAVFIQHAIDFRAGRSRQERAEQGCKQ